MAKLVERLRYRLEREAAKNINDPDLAEAAALIEGMEKDAARYRWLRDKRMLRVGPIIDPNRSNRCRYILADLRQPISADCETLDAAIDAAIKDAEK